MDAQIGAPGQHILDVLGAVSMPHARVGLTIQASPPPIAVHDQRDVPGKRPVSTVRRSHRV
jgi:hypothetical protein